jgi:plasmid maintenance system antidote protein VapI
VKTDEDLQAELYELCKDRQGKWAKEHGFTREYINQVCNGKKPMTNALAKILGYKRAEGWVKRKPK